MPSRIVFLTGLHRSGTTPLYHVLSAHPEISGFVNTGVPQDEGQHLQTVVPTGKTYGGPGRFAFDARSYLDETSPLATPQTAEALWSAWSPWWDLSRRILLEKSPPTLVRLRFYRSLFPESRFIMIVRHPVIAAKATQKWSRTSLTELVLHWCLAHERFLSDAKHLGDDLLVVRYEDCVAKPEDCADKLLGFLGVRRDVRLGALTDHNDKYELTEVDRQQMPFQVLSERFSDLLDHFGYRLDMQGSADAPPPSDEQGRATTPVAD